jgi:hypothetical protein
MALNQMEANKGILETLISDTFIPLTEGQRFHRWFYVTARVHDVTRAYKLLSNPASGLNLELGCNFFGCLTAEYQRIQDLYNYE